MRHLLAGILIVCVSMASAVAQVSVGVSIGVNLPAYPRLVVVPGYPVYHAPALNANFFFYDGMYWVFEDDRWYMSAWYNGPWALVSPLYVPAYVLRVPVRYYRVPPPYFGPWYAGAPPRWGEHWGDDWRRQRKGWDQWNRAAVPAPAPLPVYQRAYAGERYPQQVERQQALRGQNYRYEPREPVVRQQYQGQRAQAAALPSRPQPQGVPQDRGVATTQDLQHPAGPSNRKPPANPGPPAREPPPQRSNQADMPQDRGATPSPQGQGPNRGQRQGPDQGQSQGQGQGKGRDQGEEREHGAGQPK